jgi:ParB-like chromosome segregation protein Spo0J
MMQIRDRIRELRRVPASALVPNPRNWRMHPQRQREALQGVLAEIGYADALLARETSDGRLMLIDGHLRAETTPHCDVPVLVLDITEAEADKLLATLDPLAALADPDAERLAGLLADVQTDSAGVRALLDDLSQRAAKPRDIDAAADEISRQYTILITCDDESQQVALLERFASEGLSCRALVV